MPYSPSVLPGSNYKVSLGLPNFDATGKNVTLPKENFTVTFNGDKINSIVSGKVEGSGVLGIVQQLGFEIPSNE